MFCEEAKYYSIFFCIDEYVNNYFCCSYFDLSDTNSDVS